MAMLMKDVLLSYGVHSAKWKMLGLIYQQRKVGQDHIPRSITSVRPLSSVQAPSSSPRPLTKGDGKYAFYIRQRKGYGYCPKAEKTVENQWRMLPSEKRMKRPATGVNSSRAE